MKPQFTINRKAEPPRSMSTFQKNSAISGAPKVDASSANERAGRLIGKISLAGGMLFHGVIFPAMLLYCWWSYPEVDVGEVVGRFTAVSLGLFVLIALARLVANGLTAHEEEYSYQAIGLHIAGFTVNTVLGITLHVILR